MLVKRELLHKVLVVFFGILLIFLLLSAKMYYVSMTEFKQGEILKQQQKYYKAIVHYDRALRSFLPYNPYMSRALGRLKQIGIKFEKEKRSKDALALYENIHGTLMSTQNMLTTNKKKLAELRTKIKTLSPSPQFSLNKKQPPPPQVFWALLQGLGLLGWIFSAVIFIRKGKSNTALLCLITFFVIWLMGISLA